MNQLRCRCSFGLAMVVWSEGSKRCQGKLYLYRLTLDLPFQMQDKDIGSNAETVHITVPEYFAFSAMYGTAALVVRCTRSAHAPKGETPYPLDGLRMPCIHGNQSPTVFSILPSQLLCEAPTMASLPRTANCALY